MLKSQIERKLVRCGVNLDVNMPVEKERRRDIEKEKKRDLVGIDS